VGLCSGDGMGGVRETMERPAPFVIAMLLCCYVRRGRRRRRWAQRRRWWELLIKGKGRLYFARQARRHAVSPPETTRITDDERNTGKYLLQKEMNVLVYISK
jgi:hypothetical protein